MTGGLLQVDSIGLMCILVPEKIVYGLNNMIVMYVYIKKCYILV